MVLKSKKWCQIELYRLACLCVVVDSQVLPPVG